MKLVFKKLRLPFVAIISALMIVLATGTQSFAAQPGEENVYHQELIGGNQPFQLRSASGVSEARDSAGNLVEIWVGWETSLVYVSVNHGPAQLWADTVSYSEPSIIWTPIGFRAYHVGTDGGVYWSTVTWEGSRINLGTWTRVPNGVLTSSALSVSVIALPGGDVYMAYRGANSRQLYDVYYNLQSNSWTQPLQVPNAFSPTAPTLAYQLSGWNQLVLVFQGEDNIVNVVFQNYGNGTWVGPYTVGGISTNQRVSVALTPNGHGQIAALSEQSGRISFITLNSNRTVTGGWTSDSANAPLEHPTMLNDTNTLYVTGVNVYGFVYYKRSGGF